MAESSQAKRMAKELGKGAYKAGKAAGKKAGRLLIKILKWTAPAWGGGILMLLLIAGVIGALLGGNTSQEYDPTPVASAVRKYEQVVLKYAVENGIEDYVNVLLAIMQQESAGEGTDVMQSSESSFNERYPKIPGSIKEPEYSIEVGVRYFAECLKLAGCESVEDTDLLSLAVQGYNYGLQYISWALERDGKYTQENAAAFSELKAQELDREKYGDPYYVPKVLQYYMEDMDAEYIYPLADHHAISSGYGYRQLEGRPAAFHKGTDFPAPEGTPILASSSGTVIASEYNRGGYGYRIKILHADGSITHYAHCSKLLVSANTYVTKGQVIALVGSTGDSTGNHLHIEMIMPGNRYIDPMSKIGKAG